jgi:hypothetical protein
MPDAPGRWTITEVLLDLAQHPDRVLALAEAPDANARQKLLEQYYGKLISRGGKALIKGNLKQIRVEVEAHFEFSDPKTVVKVTFAVVTF